MRDDKNSKSEPVIIKKYANRRLYNTDTSTYVTLDDLAAMVRLERDFVVYDAKTGEDLTHSVLTQIIVDQESRGQNLLPIGFLRQLIRFYGDSIEKLVPSYLELSLDTLTNQQDKYRKQFSETFGAANALEAMQEHTRQNMAMFEKAMAIFSPFGQVEISDEGEAVEQKEKSPSSKGAGKKAPKEDAELAALRAQLSDMQDKLEKLSK